MENTVFSEKVDFYRMFFAVSILIGHYTYNWNIDSVYMVIFIWPAMTFFYFMSGYWFALSLQKYSPRILMRKKVKSLLIPYIIWKSIGIMVNFLFYSIRGVESIEECIRLSMYGNAPVGFMIKLFFLMCVAVLISKIISSYFFGAVFLLLCILILYANNIGYDYCIQWVFFGGEYVGFYYSDKFKNFFSTKKSVLSCLIALVLLVLGVMLYKSHSNLPGVIYTLISLVVILLGTNWNCRLPVKFPTAMAIYCIHFIPLQYIYAVVRRILGAGSSGIINILGWFVSAVLAMTVVIIGDYFIRKFKWNSVLYGQRN